LREWRRIAKSWARSVLTVSPRNGCSKDCLWRSLCF
jgi:hypothetical protein